VEVQFYVGDLLIATLPVAKTSAVLAVMHWFPWHETLRRTTAYALGTAAVVGIPAATMVIASALGLQYSQPFWAGLLVVNALVAGATVNLAYWIDGKRAVGHEDVKRALEVQDAETWS
jgi:MFS family permease